MKDKELRDQVEHALEFEPSIDAADIGVAVQDGVVTLTGHVGTYAQKCTAERVVQAVQGVHGIAQEIEVRNMFDRGCTDDQIAERALNIIAWDVTVPDDKIQVTVQKGWVTLSGSVDWHFQRMAAERAVRKLYGVIGVSNQIMVQPVLKVRDIKHRIEAALKRSAEVEASGVTVSVKDDKVILDGRVRSWVERGAIERAAWAAPGVSHVEDRLVIS